MLSTRPAQTLDHLPAVRRDLGRRLGGLSLALGALTLALHTGQTDRPAMDAASDANASVAHLAALATAAAHVERTVIELDRALTDVRDVSAPPVHDTAVPVSPVRFTSRLTGTVFGGFADVPLHARAASVDRESTASGGPSARPHRGDVADSDRAPFVVMLDPGHGGTDPGAVAHNGLLEKELTRDIAERVRLFLSEVDDIEVRMTREGDTGLSRQQRVNRVRDSGADLLLSLHFNHLPQTSVTLVESYYAAAENIAESRAIRREASGERWLDTTAPDLRFIEGSARLAGLVQQRVYDEVSHENAHAHDAGVKRETLFVLTRSETAGTLVELTCLSNPAEADRLASEPYRDRLAAALADAVRDYRRSLADRPLGALDV